MLASTTGYAKLDILRAGLLLQPVAPRSPPPRFKSTLAALLRAFLLELGDCMA